MAVLSIDAESGRQGIHVNGANTLFVVEKFAAAGAGVGGAFGGVGAPVGFVIGSFVGFASTVFGFGAGTKVDLPIVLRQVTAEAVAAAIGPSNIQKNPDGTYVVLPQVDTSKFLQLIIPLWIELAKTYPGTDDDFSDVVGAAESVAIESSLTPGRVPIIYFNTQSNVQLPGNGSIGGLLSGTNGILIALVVAAIIARK